MDVRSLPHACLVELKCDYYTELVNEGIFGEIVYGDNSIKEPSWGDIVYADETVPDDIIFEHYAGIDFVKDDFFCMMEMSYDEWEKIELEAMENDKC